MRPGSSRRCAPITGSSFEGRPGRWGRAGCADHGVLVPVGGAGSVPVGIGRSCPRRWNTSAVTGEPATDLHRCAGQTSTAHQPPRGTSMTSHQPSDEKTSDLFDFENASEPAGERQRPLNAAEGAELRARALAYNAAYRQGFSRLEGETEAQRAARIAELRSGRAAYNKASKKQQLAPSEKQKRRRPDGETRQVLERDKEEIRARNSEYLREKKREFPRQEGESEEQYDKRVDELKEANARYMRARRQGVIGGKAGTAVRAVGGPGVRPVAARNERLAHGHTDLDHGPVNPEQRQSVDEGELNAQRWDAGGLSRQWSQAYPDATPQHNAAYARPTGYRESHHPSAGDPSLLVESAYASQQPQYPQGQGEAVDDFERFLNEYGDAPTPPGPPVPPDIDLTVEEALDVLRWDPVEVAAQLEFGGDAPTPPAPQNPLPMKSAYAPQQSQYPQPSSQSVNPGNQNPYAGYLTRSENPVHRNLAAYGPAHQAQHSTHPANMPYAYQAPSPRQRNAPGR